MSKYIWVIWFGLAIVLGILNVMSLHSKDTLTEVMKAANIKIEDDQVWVEVSLKKNTHEVYIYTGETLNKKMPCSGGTEDEPTVMGVFYLQNRGEWFYSERFNEGALYWVRFYDQYLFHSVPVDKNFNTIEEEEEKIGGPASHGCIRLLKDDAKWFYENIPDQTLVIIHD